MNFYKSAALALDHLDKHKGSVKGSLVAAGLETSSNQESKRILALVIETLKYRNAIESIIDTVKLLSLEKPTFPKKTHPRQPSSRALVTVLLHDLLFSGRAKIEASDKWPPKEAILRHRTRVKAELVRLQIKEGKISKAGLARKSKVEVSARYIRWNPNISLHRPEDWSFPALLNYLQSSAKGFKLLEQPIWPVPGDSFFIDPNLPECLLAFSINTTWWQGDKWFESGAVVVQDKSSCFPAKVLMEGWSEEEGDVLDATAAPGNKTSHISSSMEDKNTLYAFEKSPTRFQILKKMLSRARCDNVKPRQADFLQSDPAAKEFAGVTRILLDPSCSGSGIVNRLDYLVDQDADEDDGARNERREKLATFQFQMVFHAFAFPAAKRIVYSTCSIHPEEDEQVVQRALESKIAKREGWSLATRPRVLPSWPRRGRKAHFHDDEELAQSVIRCVPEEDHTNGFFVACFVRRESETPMAEADTSKAMEDPETERHANGTKRKMDISPEQTEQADPYVSDDPNEQEEADVVAESKKDKTAAEMARRRRKKMKQKEKKRIKLV